LTSSKVEADLHLHTSISDGSATPREAVAEAARIGLKAIAITDHDATEGIEGASAAGRRYGVVVIPGVELSCREFSGEGGQVGREVHILGYYVDKDNSALRKSLEVERDNRVARLKRMASRLGDMGMPIDFDGIKIKTETETKFSLGRPELAEVLVREGHVSSIDEAFALYLGEGKPAYVRRSTYMTAVEGIALVRQAGGIACIAHPGLGEDEEGKDRPVIDLIPSLAAAGLQAIEVYYPQHTPEVTAELLCLAAAHGLLVTGGSDWHGTRKPELRMGASGVDMVVVNLLREAWENAG